MEWSSIGLPPASLLGNVATSCLEKVSVLCEQNLAVSFSPVASHEGLQDVTLIPVDAAPVAQAWSQDGALFIVASNTFVQVFCSEKGGFVRLERIPFAFQIKAVSCCTRKALDASKSRDQMLYWVAVAGVRGVKLVKLVFDSGQWSVDPRQVGLVQSYTICVVKLSQAGVLLVASTDGHLGVWRTSQLVEPGERLSSDWRDTVETRGRFTDAAFSQDARQFVVCAWQDGVYLYTLQPGDSSLQYIFARHISCMPNLAGIAHPTVLCLSPDAKYLAYVGGRAEMVQVWNVASAVLEKTFEASCAIVGLASFEDGFFCVCTSGAFQLFPWPQKYLSRMRRTRATVYSESSLPAPVLGDLLSLQVRQELEVKSGPGDEVIHGLVAGNRIHVRMHSLWKTLYTSGFESALLISPTSQSRSQRMSQEVTCSAELLLAILDCGAECFVVKRVVLELVESPGDRAKICVSPPEELGSARFRTDSRSPECAVTLFVGTDRKFVSVGCSCGTCFPRGPTNVPLYH